MIFWCFFLYICLSDTKMAKTGSNCLKWPKWHILTKISKKAKKAFDWPLISDGTFRSERSDPFWSEMAKITKNGTF